MKTWSAGGWVVSAALCAVLPLPIAGQQSHRLSGDEVAVYNLAGHVEVVRGSGSDVVVHVTLGGSDAGDLRVEAGALGGRATFRVIYPGDAVVYPALGRGSRTNLDVRADGTFGGGHGGDRVEIRGSGRGVEAWADLVVEVPAGKDVEVRLAAGPLEIRGVRGDFDLHTGSGSVQGADVSGALKVDTGSGSVVVAGVTGTLDVDTGSGDADVTAVRGDLTVDTGSGSVTVRDVVGGAVDLDTGSGDIDASGIEATSLRADTGSGDIDLGGVSSPMVVLDTGSGDVTVTLLRDVDRLDVDTGSGSVTVRAPESLGGDVEVETGSGGIDFDLPLQVRSFRRDRIVGTLGDGDGRIRISTGSGNVRFLKN
ncbi:MAG: DUF4097 family beta strand repeat-containing protein [Gemmatimonadota bacterium]|nr:DUF4097 family beta strand repeat-containing protein [Gemmatimonadota bacterium]